MKRLENRISIVTGAGRNLGKGIATRLAEEGASVVVADIDPAVAEHSFSEIQAKYPETKGFSIGVDVRKAKEVEHLVDEVLQKFGRIDILVNNAGVLTANPISELTEEEWDYCMDVNAKGTFLCSREVIKKDMLKRKAGKIISISSNAGKRGWPFIPHYCASKFAVIGLTQALAKELLPYNINVNAVCPGMLNLPQHFGATEKAAKFMGLTQSLEELLNGQRKERIRGRLGEPEDIAGLVAYLASSESDYMTGQAINMCGGSETY